MNLQILFYCLTLIFISLIGIFGMGLYHHQQSKKNNIWAENTWLIVITSIFLVAGFTISVIPYFMQVWTLSSDEIHENTILMTILSLEFLLSFVFFLIIYVATCDYGLVINKDETDENDILYNFSNKIKIKQITNIEELRFCVKITYTTGALEFKRTERVFSPKMRRFVLENLIVKNNIVMQESTVVSEETNHVATESSTIDNSEN